MNLKKSTWGKRIAIFCCVVFTACIAFVIRGEEVPVTPYPYNETGVVMGYSGVYDVWLFEKYWTSEDEATQELKDWLNDIAEYGGNIVRIFSHYNGYNNEAETPWEAWKYNRITMSPWEKAWDSVKKKYLYDVNTLYDHYFIRLGKFMELLKERKLTAWIDIWDFSSIKGDAYLTYPFWCNSNNINIPHDLTQFVIHPQIINWRKAFQDRLVNTTYNYSPIYSTNEFSLPIANGINYNIEFLKEITNYLNLNPIKPIPLLRISHSSKRDNDELNAWKPNQLLLSLHKQAKTDQFDNSYLNFGIRVISSDGQESGSGGYYPHFDKKRPLSAQEVYDSMTQALKLGFSGLEILDREEYHNSYYEPDLYALDTETLDSMVAAYLENVVTVTSPNGGEAWDIGLTKTITWKSPASIWGKYVISLWSANSQLGIIATIDHPETESSYQWTVGQYIGGMAPLAENKYRIRIRRITDDGHVSILSDFSNAKFSIVYNGRD